MNCIIDESCNIYVSAMKRKLTCSIIRRVGANVTRVGADVTIVGADVTRVGADVTRVGADVIKSDSAETHFNICSLEYNSILQTNSTSDQLNECR